MKLFHTLTRHEPISHFSSAWSGGDLHSKRRWVLYSFPNSYADSVKSTWTHFDISWSGRLWMPYKALWWEKVLKWFGLLEY